MPYDLPRIPLPTSSGSAAMSALPAQIRQQAVWSARLSLAEPVSRMGAMIREVLEGRRSASEFRRDMREALYDAGYMPPDGAAGTLQDHTARSRLDLILTQNVRAARNYGQWAEGMDADVLDAFPAQELLRIYNRKNPRPRSFWRARWTEAGGTLREGRMVALKTSPVWSGISRFGLPYPPYDYGSGMGVLDVSREEAERLGLIAPDAEIEPAPVPFPAIPQLAVPSLADQDALIRTVLDMIPGATFEGGALKLPEEV